MWKILLTVSSISFWWALVQADYTLAASNDVGSYHYPVPLKSQQLYDAAVAQQSGPRQTYQTQYQGNNNAPALVQPTAVIMKQFASPALDSEAFRLALAHQGYTYAKTSAFSAALTAGGRSRKTTSQTPASSSTPVIGSLNIKLPLPIGVTPLNIAPLPLQTGTAYANIPNGVTSYGTVYPQRK